MGNRAVQRLVQAKLTVGAADDEYEREADRIARQVMSMSDATVARALRRAALPEEDRKLLTKPRAETLTRRAQGLVGEDEEELIQTRRAEPDVGSFEAGDEIETQLSLSKGRGNSLPEPVRAFMEPRFGVDFGQVRVHSDREAAQMNEAVGARAFTHGQDIYFGAGQSSTDLALTAHELTHVVQQTGGMPLQAKRREELLPMDAGPSVQRACAACASGAAPCPRCAEEGSALRRKQVGTLSVPAAQRARRVGYALAPSDVLYLQRIHGNQAVNRLLTEVTQRWAIQSRGSTDLMLDTYLPEADRVVQPSADLVQASLSRPAVPAHSLQHRDKPVGHTQDRRILSEKSLVQDADSLEGVREHHGQTNAIVQRYALTSFPPDKAPQMDAAITTANIMIQRWLWPWEEDEGGQFQGGGGESGGGGATGSWGDDEHAGGGGTSGSRCEDQSWPKGCSDGFCERPNHKCVAPTYQAKCVCVESAEAGG